MLGDLGKGEHVLVDLEAGSVEVEGLLVVVVDGVHLGGFEDLLHEDRDRYESFLVVRKDQLEAFQAGRQTVSLIASLKA